MDEMNKKGYAAVYYDAVYLLALLDPEKHGKTLLDVSKELFTFKEDIWSIEIKYKDVWTKVYITLYDFDEEDLCILEFNAFEKKYFIMITDEELAKLKDDIEYYTHHQEYCLIEKECAKSILNEVINKITVYDIVIHDKEKIDEAEDFLV